MKYYMLLLEYSLRYLLCDVNNYVAKQVAICDRR